MTFWKRWAEKDAAGILRTVVKSGKREKSLSAIFSSTRQTNHSSSRVNTDFSTP
jgi:hypothetical protein